MKNCDISVIIPVYNAEKYIEACVRSILAQTLPPSEVILVNDGSTDSSPTICDTLAAKYPCIQVIHKENGGAATARNRGLDEAKGDLLMFVDGDDLLHPQALELLLYLLQQKNADIAMGHYLFFQTVPPNDQPINISNCPYEILSGPALLDDFTAHCRKVSLISLCMKLYRREIFNGLRIPEGFIEEDSLVLPHILERAKRIVRTEQKLYYWRETPGSVTRSGFSAKQFAFIEVSVANAKFFAKRKNKNVTRYFRKQFLQRCLMFYYMIPPDRKDLLEAFRPYKQLYRKKLLGYCFSAKLSPRVLLAYFLFLFSPKVAEKFYKQVYGDAHI